MSINPTALELKNILGRVPDDSPVVIILGENYADKKTELTAYSSLDGEVVIQFWGDFPEE